MDTCWKQCDISSSNDRRCSFGLCPLLVFILSPTCYVFTPGLVPGRPEHILGHVTTRTAIAHALWRASKCTRLKVGYPAKLPWHRPLYVPKRLRRHKDPSLLTIATLAEHVLGNTRFPVAHKYRPTIGLTGILIRLMRLQFVYIADPSDDGMATSSGGENDSNDDSSNYNDSSNDNDSNYNDSNDDSSNDNDSNDVDKSS